MSYAQLVAEDIRLGLLQILEQEPDYAQNDYVLGRALGMLGHTVGGDRVRTELHWLAEQGLVAIKTVSSVLVAKLTNRGEDAALGKVRVPGIARPRPQG